MTEAPDARLRFYEDDPESEPDEISTPRHLWFHTKKCDACMEEAITKCWLSRGEDLDPAKFSLCGDHACNVALAGGEVELV